MTKRCTNAGASLSSIVLLLLLLPQSAHALMLSELYVSNEVPVQSGGHRAATSSAAFSSVLLQKPVSNEVPVQFSSAPISSQASSVYVAPPEPKVSSSIAPVISSAASSSSVSSLTKEQQAEEDSKVLSEISAYANPGEQTPEEQLELLKKGFSVTSTSTLGNPLPISQREAILRSTPETFEQLKLFAKALAESDDNIRKFAIDGESVTITYRAKAYMFGFIPLSYLQKITVRFDGYAKVDGPWWLLMADDNVDEAEEYASDLFGDMFAGKEATDIPAFSTLAKVLSGLFEAAKEPM